jgi:hypothetical protein
MNRHCRRKERGMQRSEGAGTRSDAQHNDMLKMLREEEGLMEALMPPNSLREEEEGDGSSVGGDGDAISGDDYENPNVTASVRVTSYMGWLKTPQFYVVGVVYMATRLLINVVNVYITFFLSSTLESTASSIAVVPLCMMFSSFLCTQGLSERMNKTMGRKGSYLAGSTLVCSACLWSNFVEPETSDMVYGIAVLLGAGTSVVMVSGVSFVNDLVGNNLETSAFVYGCMSFTDKLCTGAVVLAIQQRRDSVCEDEMEEGCKEFVRDVMVWVPAASAALAGVALCAVKNRKK